MTIRDKKIDIQKFFALGVVLAVSFMATPQIALAEVQPKDAMRLQATEKLEEEALRPLPAAQSPGAGLIGRELTVQPLRQPMMREPLQKPVMEPLPRPALEAAAPAPTAVPIAVPEAIPAKTPAPEAMPAKAPAEEVEEEGALGFLAAIFNEPVIEERPKGIAERLAHREQRIRELQAKRQEPKTKFGIVYDE